MQAVERPEGMVAEFSSEECPTDLALLPESSLAFTLTMDLSPGGGLALLRREGVLVGEAQKTSESEPESTWVLRHLCQISDSQLAYERYFSEVCSVEFEPDFGPKLGRFRALDVVTLEALARRKISESKNLKLKETSALLQSAQFEVSQVQLRRERDQALLDRADSLEKLAEARRGVRDSVASNLTVHRGLERTKAEAELEAAKNDVQYFELSIRFAKAEHRRAQMLKERLDSSVRAKSREMELKKQLELFEKQIPAKEVDTQQAKQFRMVLDQMQIVLDQNRHLILNDEERRKLEEEATFAASEAERLTELEKDKLPAALNQAVEKKRQLSQLDRLPPPTEAVSDPGASPF